MHSKTYTGEELFIGADVRGNPLQQGVTLGNVDFDEDVGNLLKKWKRDLPYKLTEDFTHVVIEMVGNAAHAFREVVRPGIGENDSARLTMELRNGFIGLRMTNLADAFHAARALDQSSRLMKLDPAARVEARAKHGDFIRNRMLMSYRDQDGVPHNGHGFGLLAVAATCEVFRISVLPVPDDYPVNLCKVRTIAAMRLPR